MKSKNVILYFIFAINYFCQEMMSLAPKPLASTMKELDSNFKIPLPFDEPKFPLDSKVEYINVNRHYKQIEN